MDSSSFDGIMPLVIGVTFTVLVYAAGDAPANDWRKHPWLKVLAPLLAVAGLIQFLYSNFA